MRHNDLINRINSWIEIHSVAISLALYLSRPIHSLRPALRRALSIFGQQVEFVATLPVSSCAERFVCSSKGNQSVTPKWHWFIGEQASIDSIARFAFAHMFEPNSVYVNEFKHGLI